MRCIITAHINNTEKAAFTFSENALSEFGKTRNL
jgi:hypothetical protein